MAPGASRWMSLTTGPPECGIGPQPGRASSCSGCGSVGAGADAGAGEDGDDESDATLRADSGAFAEAALDVVPAEFERDASPGPGLLPAAGDCSPVAATDGPCVWVGQGAGATAGAVGGVDAIADAGSLAGAGSGEIGLAGAGLDGGSVATGVETGSVFGSAVPGVETGSEAPACAMGASTAGSGSPSSLAEPALEGAETGAAVTGEDTTDADGAGSVGAGSLPDARAGGAATGPWLDFPIAGGAVAGPSSAPGLGAGVGAEAEAEAAAELTGAGSAGLAARVCGPGARA